MCGGPDSQWMNFGGWSYLNVSEKYLNENRVLRAYGGGTAVGLALKCRVRLANRLPALFLF